MRPIPDLATICTQLPGLRAEMLDRLTPAPKTANPNPTGCGSPTTGSMPETLLIRKDQVQRAWQLVEAWAAELTWRGNTHDGNPAVFIASRLKWAEKNLPDYEDMVKDLTSIFMLWEQATKTAAPLTGTICPRCGQPLTAPTENTTYCINCGERTFDQTEAERTHRINSAGRWYTFRELKTNYGISWHEIHEAIKQGKLHPAIMPPENTHKLHTIELAKVFPDVIN